MRFAPVSNFLLPALSVAVITFSLAVSSPAQTEVVLHNFTGGRDGGGGYAPVMIDPSGNIYGTTLRGGDLSACSGAGCGVVFRLSPTSTGGWAETVLHAFAGNYMGGVPDSGVIRDSAGNLYGSASGGGFTFSACGSTGCGIVYELSRTSAGGYKEKVLHAFTAGSDGYLPAGNLVFDSHGNLYGVTVYGGSSDAGTVFELSPTSSGVWTESILLNFGPSTGANPFCTLIFDSAGNLYGTAQVGGANVNGTVFKLSPGSGGTWTETNLYDFGPSPDLSNPGSLASDATGNLYGPGEGLGSSGQGGVFQLTKSTSIPWPESVIFNFNDTDGSDPFTNVAFDTNGNLFVSAAFGGADNCGSIVKLSPSSSGWSSATYWNFDCTHGQTPNALTTDAAGNVYGVTTRGGAHSQGVVFEIKP